MKLVLLSLLLLGAAAHAEILPRAGSLDPHIQTVDYDPNQVVRLQVAPGYALTIEFSPDERIENVAVGASGAWQVTPNRRADHLFVKQTGDAPDTNMTVITDSRRYVFTLASGNSAEAPYVLRFVYPGLNTAPDVAVELPPHTGYKVSGAKALRPALMFDDGRSTSIRWPADVNLPAVYAVDEHGRETIVNGAMRGGLFVVDAVAPKYVFRSGSAQAVAVRQTPKRRK